jgi:hypothetical protein
MLQVCRNSALITLIPTSNGSRRLAANCLIFGVAIYAWSGFMLAAYDDSLQSAGFQKKTSDNRARSNPSGDKTATTHAGQPLHDSKGFFIPLGWPQLKEGKFYKASDPEWKTLVKVSKDKERVQALKGLIYSHHMCCFDAY